jgi:hypothetical protein
MWNYIVNNVNDNAQFTLLSKELRKPANTRVSRVLELAAPVAEATIRFAYKSQN